eukprot:m.229248 g.229248  ORF g.229248 m.229248 type:complete len:401 (+) comp18837_c0_seq6:44-1246(+)
MAGLLRLVKLTTTAASSLLSVSGCAGSTTSTRTCTAALQWSQRWAQRTRVGLRGLHQAGGSMGAASQCRPGGLRLYKMTQPLPCGWSSPIARLTPKARLPFVRHSHQETKKIGGPIQVLTELLTHAPLQVFVGICVGGLGASIAGFLYFMHLTGRLDLRRIFDGVDKVEITVKRSEKGDDDQSFGLPFPAFPVIGWTLMFLVTTAAAWGRARLRLQFRTFTESVNFSLNLIEDNTLRFRTIKECHLSATVPQSPAVMKVVTQTALKTTPERPFLQLPDDLRTIIMNAVMNQMSTGFAEGFFAADQKLPVHRAWYRLGITYRKDVVKMRKLRVMIVSEDLLERIPSMTSPPEYENPSYSIRWHTLQEMARLYHADKNKPEYDQLLSRFEIAMPCSGQPSSW